MPLTRPPTRAMTTNQPSIPTCLASSSEATVALLPSLVTCGKSTTCAHTQPPIRPAAANQTATIRTSNRAGTTRAEVARAAGAGVGDSLSASDLGIRPGWHLGLHLGRHPRHPGPSRCLRSP